MVAPPPVNITDDLLVGGAATASATFRVAALSGNVTAGTINTNTLTASALTFSGAIQLFLHLLQIQV